ncbi:cyclase family protein [Lentzea sp. CC55]|uniref:cyclase family protein n=1 Tax=Lentzea sp. CC55 TaxID=2884909 RepID=UPI001F38BDD2|nr:cyclase family protein [Lentzea sp. CC55]MCG8927539.1 cyclase family protein [Lentzea sp. CC55]
MRRIIDLSHPIHHGMTTIRGMKTPSVTTYVSREETAARMAPGVSFEIGQIDLIANTGTYLDTPSHYHQDGYDTAGLPLERVADVPAVVLRPGDPILPELEGFAVLFHTGWSRHWGTDTYQDGHPFLTSDVVDALIAVGPALVGIDSLNIDDATDPSRPAHQGLLRAGIPIVEHLTNLEQVPARGARFTALPMPVVGMGTMPVRAIAIVNE